MFDLYPAGLLPLDLCMMMRMNPVRKRARPSMLVAQREGIVTFQ